jgi:hypothetical protein
MKRVRTGSIARRRRPAAGVHAAGGDLALRSDRRHAVQQLTSCASCHGCWPTSPPSIRLHRPCRRHQGAAARICSDALLAARRDLRRLAGAADLRPGDNEWTDCRHLPAGKFDPLERLQKLRQLFFAAPRSLGRSVLPLERQPGDYPEHLRWRLGPVLFISLNVPGPNNHFGLGVEPSAEFVARNPAVIDWLRQGFAVARRERLAGIVIVMQGNPAFKPPRRRPAACRLSRAARYPAPGNRGFRRAGAADPRRLALATHRPAAARSD